MNTFDQDVIKQAESAKGSLDTALSALVWVGYAPFEIQEYVKTTLFDLAVSLAERRRFLR